MAKRQSRWVQKKPNNTKKGDTLSILCKRDEFIFRCPYSDSALATIKELPLNMRRWDDLHKVWRLSPTAKVFTHLIKLSQDYFNATPSIYLHDNLSFEEIVEGRTVDLTTHYTTLGVERTASEKEIKRAYRRMAMQYHPDKGGPDGGKYFVAINRAYECLMNPNKRKRYDAILRVMESKHQARLGSYRNSVFN